MGARLALEQWLRPSPEAGEAGGWHQVGRCISPGLGPVPSELHLGLSTFPVCLSPHSPLPGSLPHQPAGKTAVAAAATAVALPRLLGESAALQN